MVGKNTKNEGAQAPMSRTLRDEIVRLRAEIEEMHEELRDVEDRAARLLRARNAMAVRCAQLQLELTDLRNGMSGAVSAEARRATG